MDENTKQRALEKTTKMLKYIGYHDNLRSALAETFYDDLPPLNEANLLEMGMAFQIFSADREFKRYHAKGAAKGEKDWTK